MTDAWFDWTYDGRGWYLVNDPEVTFYGEEEAMEYCDERNRATIEAQAEEIERLKGKLREIEDMCPVTCDMSVAHAMADVATEALAGKAEQ